MQAVKTLILAVLMIVGTLFVNNAADAAETLKKTTTIISEPTKANNQITFTVGGNVKLVRHAKSLNSSFAPTSITGGTKAKKNSRITGFAYNCPGYYTSRLYSDVNGTQLIGYIQVYVSTSDINNSSCAAITPPPQQQVPPPPAPQPTHPDPLIPETLTPAPQPVPQKYETILEMNEPEIIEIPPTIEEPEPMTWEQYCKKLDNANPGFGRHVPMPVAADGEVYAKCCPIGGDAAYTIFNKSNLAQNQIFAYLTEGNWVCGKIMDDTEIEDTYCPSGQIYDRTTNQCKVSSSTNRLSYTAPIYSSGWSELEADKANDPTEPEQPPPDPGAEACDGLPTGTKCETYCRNNVDTRHCAELKQVMCAISPLWQQSGECGESGGGGYECTSDQTVNPNLPLCDEQPPPYGSIEKFRLRACKMPDSGDIALQVYDPAIITDPNNIPLTATNSIRFEFWYPEPSYPIQQNIVDEQYGNYILSKNASGYGKIQMYRINGTKNEQWFTNTLTEQQIKSTTIICSISGETPPTSGGGEQPGDNPQCEADPMHEDCVPDCYCPTLENYGAGLGFMCCVWDCPGLSEIISDFKDFLADDLVGDAVAPEVPQFDPPTARDIFENFNDVNKREQPPITTIEDPNLGTSSFTADDVKDAAGEIQFEDDPTDGFSIVNPLDTLPKDGSTAPRPDTTDSSLSYPKSSANSSGGNAGGSVPYPSSTGGSATPPTTGGSVPYPTP